MKLIGYTFTIACKKPAEVYVFSKYMKDKDEAIAYAESELESKSEYGVQFILIRLGTIGAQDPIIWDSRRDYKPKPAEKHWLDKIIKQQADHYGMTVEQQSRLMHDVAVYLEENPETTDALRNQADRPGA